MARYFILILSAFLVLGCGGGGGGSAGRQVEPARLTTFENEVLAIDSVLLDGTGVRFNTEDDSEGPARPFVTEMPDHDGRAWALLKEGGEDTFIGYAVVSWNRNDPGDYLAAGWWIHFKNQRYPDIDPYHPDSQSYVFIDGPELRPESPRTFPATGTASYTGGAGGRYLYQYGDDWGEDLKDKISSVEFQGLMTLTADFDVGTIRGSLSNLRESSQHLASAFDRFDADRAELRQPPDGYVVDFAPTQFHSDGTFYTKEGISVTHPNREITSYPANSGAGISRIARTARETRAW